MWAWLIAGAVMLAAPTIARATVQVEGELVSASFEATPVPAAVEAIRRATGVDLVLPGPSRAKTVTLQVERVPFEQFLRRFLQTLELGGYAVIYEATGVARRVIVVERGSDAPAASAASAPAENAAGTGAAQPGQVAPATQPVYVPPATPPVYIPPAKPPVYIPPATPPVYVPPATEPQPAPKP
jgi:hypothetical protein